LNCIERHIVFGGEQQVWSHESEVLNCKMKFAVFLPEKVKSEKCHTLYWLSGLTCTEQNFITKSGMQKYAAEHGLVVVAPDTSPRGENVANDDAYDLGQGAGFYLNATELPWSAHYKMYDYITKELPALIEGHFNVSTRKSISGHSMGGHGAMVCYLKNLGMYESVSAFSPICAPCDVPWGEKAFTTYLGSYKADWEAWDSSKLLESVQNEKVSILIDQGLEDDFLEEQLKPKALVEVAKKNGHDVQLRMQEGYDHSYYFIASFIEDHIAYHAKYLK